MISTRYALSWSGGKDSMLALDRARLQGVDVALLVNIYEGNSGRVRFHGVRHELIRSQAEALGIPLIQDHTHPDDYEAALLRVLSSLRERGIGGVIFGDIHLADIRTWYEERVTRLGLEQREPLWGEEPVRLLAELVERGYRSRIVSVDPARAPVDWLGREIDDNLLAAITKTDIDPCGEYGEYHSFVFAGPRFQAPVSVRDGAIVEMEGHRILDLIPVD